MDKFFLENNSVEGESNSESDDHSQKIQESERSSLNIRSNHKNKYINKIRDLGV